MGECPYDTTDLRIDIDAQIHYLEHWIAEITSMEVPANLQITHTLIRNAMSLAIGNFRDAEEAIRKNAHWPEPYARDT